MNILGFFSQGTTHSKVNDIFAMDNIIIRSTIGLEIISGCAKNPQRLQ